VKIALVSDAWSPQVNGVVRTLQTTVAGLRTLGHVVETITPDQFRTFPCPGYPEIRLALGSDGEVRRRLSDIEADAVHIATEGPLGWAARRWCRDTAMPFTTSFHTRFPEYLALRTGLSPKLFWPVVRRFHAPATRIMVATPTLAAELATQGLHQTHSWSRGVDLALFSPQAARHPAFAALPRPIMLYVGRVAIEKNITAFLDAPVVGTKVVVGDGPARGQLQQTYRSAHFLGAMHGQTLASAYASSDVFVFPSRTDTFGLVMIEALASGTPVAGFPVPGPLDIVGAQGRGRTSGRGVIGALDKDLTRAIGRALTARPDDCLAEARDYSWRNCTAQFLNGLECREAPAEALAA
jgi:glycosyltransferase involved in cell wall biosynthesis